MTEEGAGRPPPPRRSRASRCRRAASGTVSQEASLRHPGVAWDALSPLSMCPSLTEASARLRSLPAEGGEVSTLAFGGSATQTAGRLCLTPAPLRVRSPSSPPARVAPTLLPRAPSQRPSARSASAGTFRASVHMSGGPRTPPSVPCLEREHGSLTQLIPHSPGARVPQLQRQYFMDDVQDVAGRRAEILGFQGMDECGQTVRRRTRGEPARSTCFSLQLNPVKVGVVGGARSPPPLPVPTLVFNCERGRRVPYGPQSRHHRVFTFRFTTWL